jgi:hypothetical protein
MHMGSAGVLAIWFTRALVYFLVQGGGLLVAYGWMGFATSPDVFPPGLRLDPIHAGVHTVSGAAAAYVGFARPRHAPWFVLAFAVFYLGLALLGTFTHHHFGMRLGTGENLFHWIIGPAALAVGLTAVVAEQPAEGSASD